MNKSIQKYVGQNIGIISKILVVYAIGIVIGIVLFSITDIKQEYINIVKEIFDMTKQENFSGINIVANGIKNNTTFIVLLYSTILTVIAPLLVCLFIILRAIITGIYMCTIFCIFGIGKGIIVVVLGIIIPLIVSLLGYILICTNVINIFHNMSNGNKIELKDIIKQIYWLIISYSLISFSIVIEQLMTSIIFNMYKQI